MNNLLLILLVMLPLLAALAMLLFKGLRENRVLRNWYVFGAVSATLVLYLICFASELTAVSLFSLNDRIRINFALDGMGKLFAGLTIAMWLVSSVFHMEYLKHEKDELRYHFFFLASLTALLGVCASENLVTMYVFYEMMTLLTFPLVLHNLSREAIQASLKYLFYSMGGAFLGLLGIFYLSTCLDSFSFVAGGHLNLELLAGKENRILAVVFCMIIGFGSKAGMWPLHGWLPSAHPVAPAPASALLSGNVTKMGVLAIIRVIYYTVGADFIRGTWVQYAFLAIALLTVFMGSMLAYREKIFKKRLAYSTISQVSYVLFGVALLHPIGMLGALLHVIFHSVVKNNLFLTTGAIIYKTGKKRVSELRGIGKEMPVVIWCFTIASITLIGIPPTSAFLSKWYLAEGALSSEIRIFGWLGPVVLLLSALLTAGYLLCVTIDGFFPGKDFDYKNLRKLEPNWHMTMPLIVLAVTCVYFGMFPTTLISALTDIVSTIL